MAPGTDWNIISYDASGNPVAVATGTAGQVLTSAGAGAPPTFAAASGETNTPAFLAYANADQSGISGNTYTKITNYGVEVFDTDNKFASGSTFTPGVVGKYFVFATVYGQTNNGYRSFLDRKSTRLNSSHRCISYAVFCLKKKTNSTPVHDNHHFLTDHLA